MKKNFSKALAGALTVAMVLGMAAPAATTAQAANKNSIKTKYKAIYAGKSKTYTLTKANKTTKWVVKGDAAEYVQLSKTKGKSTKVTVASDCPAGEKIKVVAKLKNKKGKYKKVDADSFVIKADATSVNVSGASSLTTGASSTYTATTTPAKTTNIVAFSVTDKDGKATTGATISATSGVLNAIAAGSYKVTAVTARSEANVEAGKITATASMDVTVTDKVVPDAKLTSAKQTEAKKIVVTFDSEVKDLKTEDITVTCDADKSTKTVKAITLGADKKSATIETLIDVLDGKTYTLAYKGSTASFTASDGTIADFSINNTEFQIKKPQELKVNALDKNQVIVRVVDVEEASVTDGNYAVNVTSNDGYFKDKKLVMQTVGKTEDVTATYFNGTYASNGEKNGKVEKKFTIKAVAQEALAGKYEYATIAEDQPDDWTETTCSLSIAVGEKKKNKLFAKILDVKGIPTVDGVPNISELNIACSTNDDRILLVDSSDDGVTLEGVKAGTAYVQVKQNGKVMLTIPVTVTAAKTLTNCVIASATQTISNSTRVADHVSLGYDTLKDQYNDDVNVDDVILSNVELKKYPDFTDPVDGSKPGKEWGQKVVDGCASVQNATRGAFYFPAYYNNGVQAPEGTYVFEFTLKDKNTDNTLRRSKTIVVKKPNFAKKPTVKLDGDSSADIKNGDNAVKEYKLGLYYEGVLGAYVDLSCTGAKVKNSEYAKLSFNGVNEKEKISDRTIENTSNVEKAAGLTKDSYISNGAIGYLCQEVGHIGLDKLTYSAVKFVASEQKTIDRGAKVDVADKLTKLGNGKFVDKVACGNYAIKMDLSAKFGDQKIKDIVEANANKWYGIAVNNSKGKTEVVDNAKELTKTLTVKDSQPSLVVTQVKNNVDAATAEEAIWKSCTFKYDGKTYYKAGDEDSNKGVAIWCDRQKADNLNTADVAYYKNGKVYNIAKLYVYVQQSKKKTKDSDPDNNAVIRFAITPNFSITCNN